MNITLIKTYAQLLLPICPTVLLTMHLLSSNAPNSTSAPLIIDNSERMTWRDYLMGNSVEQEMRGNGMEKTRSMEIFEKMEVYFKRCVMLTLAITTIMYCMVLLNVHIITNSLLLWYIAG